MVRKVSLGKKIAAGSVLVVLSGLVPQPALNMAYAASATINAVGTFVGGIQMGTVKTNLLFGSMVATADTGKMSVLPGGGTATSNGFFNGAAQNGTIAFKAAAGGLPVNVSVAGFVAAQALTDKGDGTQGSFTLGQATLTGPFTATMVLKSATPSKVATLNNTTGVTVPTDINVGAVVSWSGARPIGGFTVPVAVTVAY